MTRGLLALLFVFGGTVTVAAQAAAPTVTLAWDANSETDLAGYVVLWGTASGVYTQSLEVKPPPAAPTAIVDGLTPGVRYYFAVRAFNLAGQQSGLSNEVAATPGGAATRLPTPALRVPRTP